MENFMIKNKNLISNVLIVIYGILVFMGILFLIILLHEVYHLHLDGNPTGLCLGKCYVDNQTFAPAAITWEPEVYRTNNEETNAWIFSFSIVVSLLIFLRLLDNNKK